MRVKDLMKLDPITLKLDDKLQDLVDKFSTYEIRRFCSFVKLLN